MSERKGLTNIERHFLSLVHMLKHGEHSQSKFMLAIEGFQSQIRMTEERLHDMEAQNRKLRNAISMPAIPFRSEMKIRPDLQSVETSTFIWYLEPIIVRHSVRPYETEDPDFYKLLRNQSYRQVIKLVRKLFEENFDRFIDTTKFERTRRRI